MNEGEEMFHPGSRVLPINDTEKLEARVSNLEMALGSVMAILMTTQPPEIQDSIRRMMSEHFEGSYSFGGFRDLGGRFLKDENDKPGNPL